VSWLHPERPGSSRGPARCGLAALAITAVLVGVPGTAAALPPTPPPNPGDSQLDAAAADARVKTAQVDNLAGQLAGAQAQLDQVRQQLELTMELANKAQVDLRWAQDAVTAADGGQAEAQQAVTEANRALADANQQASRFAVGSYQQGSTIGAFSAYMGATNPQDLLDRVALLNAVGGSQLDVMQALEQAHTRTLTANSTAQTSKDQAAAAAGRATGAKHAADNATQAAVQAQQTQAGRAQQLQTQRNKAQYDLDNARQNVAGLQGQRLGFEQWDTQRRAAEAEAAQAAAEQARTQILAAADVTGSAPRSAGTALAPAGPMAAADVTGSAPRSAGTALAPAGPMAAADVTGSAPGSAGTALAPAGPMSATARTVIARAVSQLGVSYAWGGGNSSGPSLGVRDGGVADSYGDYTKIGFDCSGLMIYAFAGVGFSLPHYAGYQYLAGTQVPLAQMQPGDLITYSNDGTPTGIHHIAIYIGNGQMIEAQQSGTYVKVSPVRYGEGIMPSATRLL